MTRACPIMTPEERRYAEIEGEARRRLLAAIEAALDAAHATAAAALAEAGHTCPAPSRDYLTAVAHQALYCRLCGADPETLTGGDPRIALALIRNAQNVAGHHWGADIGRAPDRAERPAADGGRDAAG